MCYCAFYLACTELCDAVRVKTNIVDSKCVVHAKQWHNLLVSCRVRFAGLLHMACDRAYFIGRFVVILSYPHSLTFRSELFGRKKDRSFYSLVFSLSAFSTVLERAFFSRSIFYESFEMDLFSEINE